METQARHVLVGVATVIFGGAILATILWLAGLDVTGDRDRFVIYFEEAVSGLEEGGAVRINGVRVGTVERIRLRPERPETVTVTVAVRAGAPIARGSVAQLNPRGITGAQYIAVSAAEPDAPPLERQAQGLPVIPSEPSMMSRVLERVPGIMADIGSAADRLSAIFGEDEDGTGALIASLTEASDATPDAIQAIETAARELADLARTGRRTLGAADEALGSAAQTLRGADRLMAEELPELIAEARDAAEALAAAAEAAEALIRRNDAPIARFSTRGLSEIRHLINEARLMVDELTGVAEMLQQNPNAVIFGPAEGGFRPEDRR